MKTPPLQYRFDGPEDAPVLILGPSLGTTWHMFDRQVPELAKQWRVFRFDLPGHGGSPAHPAGSVSDLADRLLATLDALGVQRFGYAGCALGGAVGLELALRHPERVASLGLIAASPRFGTADEFRQRGVIVRTNGLDPIARMSPDRWFTSGFAAAQPAITEWAVQMVRTTDPGCYIAACEALAAFDVRSELGRIGVPTLVLVGSDDQVTGPAEARTLVAGIPDARLAVVPGASHLVPVEQPAAVTDLLLRHFSTAWQPAYDHHTGQIAITAAPVKPVLAAPPQVTPIAEIAPPPAAPPQVMGRPDPYDAGIKVRREVLGDAHVDRSMAQATDFSRALQEYVTASCWGDIWSRPGLDRRTRSLVNLAMLTALNRTREFSVHVRGAIRNGCSQEEIQEVLLQTAAYCGAPAALESFRLAERVLEELREEGPPPRDR